MFNCSRSLKVSWPWSAIARSTPPPGIIPRPGPRRALHFWPIKMAIEPPETKPDGPQNISNPSSFRGREHSVSRHHHLNPFDPIRTKPRICTKSEITGISSWLLHIFSGHPHPSPYLCVNSPSFTTFNRGLSQTQPGFWW